MKKFLVLFVFMLGVTLYAQDKPFKDLAVEFEYGGRFIDDRSAQSIDPFGESFTHAGVTVRHNYTRTFGMGASLSYDFVKMISNTGDYVSAGFPRLTMEAYVDLFDLTGMDTYTNKWTMLAHAGPGVGVLNDDTVGLVAGGFDLLRRVGKRFAIKGSYEYTGLINQKRTWDDMFPATAENITSQLHNFNVGLVWYPTKRKSRKKMHADWYVPECCAKGGDTIINNNTYVTKNLITKVTKVEYTPVIREYVFFDHDKEEVRKSELNAIFQVYVALTENSDRKVAIIGWASNTKSSAEYNQALSERRCKEIKKKLIDMGINSIRIVIDPSGKDYDFNVENVHDVARRVELLVTK